MSSSITGLTRHLQHRSLSSSLSSALFSSHPSSGHGGRSIESHVLENIVSFLTTQSNVVCITGAGVSTASGIPDYRGVNGSYKKGHKPMIHHDFITHESARKRYWSRSMSGFKYLSNATPNIAHKSLASLQRKGRITKLITQNVDGLHQKAGTENVLNLHGRIDTVKCLSCGFTTSRQEFQLDLERVNASLSKILKEKEHILKIRADGDMDLESFDLSEFQVPSCPCCLHGILKPDVVFFGDNVPRHSAEEALNSVSSSDGLLIIGSSLEVYSVFRLVRHAIKDKSLPVVIINQGITRAEREGYDIFLKTDHDCCEILEKVVRQINC